MNDQKKIEFKTCEEEEISVAAATLVRVIL